MSICKTVYISNNRGICYAKCEEKEKRRNLHQKTGDASFLVMNPKFFASPSALPPVFAKEELI